MNVAITELSNGLRVLSQRMDAVETVSLGAWVNVGTRHESAEINGIAHMLEPSGRIALEATPEQTAQGRGRGRRKCVEIDVLCQDRRKSVGHRVATEEFFPGEHFPEHDAERPNVRALVNLVTRGLLGRHVGGSAQGRPLPGQLCRRRVELSIKGNIKVNWGRPPC